MKSRYKMNATFRLVHFPPILEIGISKCSISCKTFAKKWSIVLIVLSNIFRSFLTTKTTNNRLCFHFLHKISNHITLTTLQSRAFYKGLVKVSYTQNFMHSPLHRLWQRNICFLPIPTTEVFLTIKESTEKKTYWQINYTCGEKC